LLGTSPFWQNSVKAVVEMKVSVITVAYNAGRTIHDTLYSVKEQTYHNIEHIIVDGASTDNTLEVITTHGQHVVHLISEPDHGLYDAMNKGIAKATGDIVCVLNADDVYDHENVIFNVVELMRSREMDVLIGDVVFVHPSNPLRSVRRYKSQNFNPSRIAKGWMPAHPAMFLRRTVYEKFGFYKINYKIAADFEYVARIFRDETLRYFYVPDVFVRMRTGGVSSGGVKNTILLNFEVLRACRENNIDTNFLKILSKYPKKIMEFVRR